jgi:hypothetical protein
MNNYKLIHLYKVSVLTLLKLRSLFTLTNKHIDSVQSFHFIKLIAINSLSYLNSPFFVRIIFMTLKSILDFDYQIKSQRKV